MSARPEPPERRGKRLGRVVPLDSRFFEARLLHREVLLKLGDAEASLDHFRAVRAQDPKLIHAHAGLGEARREAAVFTRLNRERARKRDRDVKRAYSP